MKLQKVKYPQGSGGAEDQPAVGEKAEYVLTRANIEAGKQVTEYAEWIA